MEGGLDFKLSLDQLNTKLGSLEQSITRITELLSEMRIEEKGVLIRLEKLEDEYRKKIWPAVEAYYGLKASVNLLKVVSTLLGVVLSIISIYTIVKSIPH